MELLSDFQNKRVMKIVLKKMKITMVFSILLFVAQNTMADQAYIKIGDAKAKKSAMAFPFFNNLGSAETGAAIDINDKGEVTITSRDAQACKKAADWVEGIVKEPQVGEEYEGMVKRILPFGAMVEISPGKEGLVHISQIAQYHVNKVEDVLKIGQTVKVKVIELDEQGRINLSMKFGVNDQDSVRDGSIKHDKFKRPYPDYKKDPQRRERQGRFDKARRNRS